MAAKSDAATQHHADEAFLTLEQTHPYSGHGDTWTWDAVKRGDFPAPIHIGRSARWLRSAVLEWQRQQIERDFRADVRPTPKNVSPGLKAARARFWADVRAGKRPHPRSKAARRGGAP